MAEFAAESGTIFYEIHGRSEEDAPTLALLHPFLSTGRQAWGRLLSGLGERFRILLPDTPGHGRSHGYPEHFDHRLLARDLARLLAAERATHGHLAGVSSGGMIAQLMVADALVTPATLTLVSTTYSNQESVLGQGRSLRPEAFQAGARWLEATARLHDPYQGEGYFDRVLLPSFRRLTAEETIALSTADLGRFMMPVCLIHGAEDEFFPRRIVEEMASAIPRAELHVLPEQSHALIFRRAWVVEELMLAFYDGVNHTAEKVRRP